jgi:iron complex transport system substrate-binding protein
LVKYFQSCLLILLSLFLTGSLSCASSPSQNDPSSDEIIDQMGRIVKLDKIPQRILSLAPSDTEILYALGLADRVVGVTDYDNYPPEVKEKPSIGGFSTPNIEKILSLSPDLILATRINEKDVIPRLEQQGLKVLGLDPRTLNEVLEAITLVGKVTGKEPEAGKLVTDMRSRINSVADKTAKLSADSRLRVLYIVWHDPLMTAGAGTFYDEMIQTAGGVNIAHSLSGYPTITLETVVAANPQVIIAGISMGAGADQSLNFVLSEPRLANTDARIYRRVHGVDSNVAGRPGPRIVDVLEEFAALIHPELFNVGKSK